MSDDVYISLFDSIPTWVMLVPIFVCSVLFLGVMLERLIFYRKINYDYRLIVNQCIEHAGSGRRAEISSLLSRYAGPVINAIETILGSDVRGNAYNALIQDVSERSVKSIEKYTGLVATIATVSPMFGLFGTVTGMMKSFSALTKVGQFAHDLLARGIAQALVTTALGLMVAIPSWIFYNYMVSKTEHFLKEIEFIANTLAELENR